MHACALTQTTPWCFPLSPFSHSCFIGLQKGSLHFGPHDTQERRIVSPVWYEILRLSPHLFWLFFSHIGRFSPLGMTVLGERMVSRGGGIAAFLEEGILVSTT